MKKLLFAIAVCFLAVPNVAQPQTPSTMLALGQIKPAPSQALTCVMVFFNGMSACATLDPSVTITLVNGQPVIAAVAIAGTPTSEVDQAGIGQTFFTLLHSPLAGTLKVYVNGLRYAPGGDYTVAGMVITMVKVLGLTDIVVFDYSY